MLALASPSDENEPRCVIDSEETPDKVRTLYATNRV
jgi:hypothetical protein